VGAVPSGSELLGDWQGAIDTGNGSLRVVFHLTQDKEGKLMGTMDSPDQKATGIVISSISLTQQDVQLAIEQYGCKYDGRLDKDKHQIVGVWKQGNASLPLTLSRAEK
jgi:hypothetical protein